jgi:hypothetical protein
MLGAIAQIDDQPHRTEATGPRLGGKEALHPSVPSQSDAEEPSVFDDFRTAPALNHFAQGTTHTRLVFIEKQQVLERRALVSRYAAGKKEPT